MQEKNIFYEIEDQLPKIVKLSRRRPVNGKKEASIMLASCIEKINSNIDQLDKNSLFILKNTLLLYRSYTDEENRVDEYYKLLENDRVKSLLQQDESDYEGKLTNCK